MSDVEPIIEYAERVDYGECSRWREPWSCAALKRDGSMIVTFKAPRELVRRLDALAKRMKMTRSELIRMAVTRLLEELGGSSES